MNTKSKHKAFFIVFLVVVFLITFTVAHYATPLVPLAAQQSLQQTAQSSSFQDWGLLVAVLVGIGGIIGVGRMLGRIEGKVDRWQKRFQDHSDKLESHHQLFVQLSVLPNLLTGLPKVLEKISEQLEELKVAIELRGKSG